MGTYPDVALKETRGRRDSAREHLTHGADPSEVRKAQKARRADRDSGTFEAVAREWLAKHAPRWAPGHASKIIGRLERDIFPWLGGRPVSKVMAPELLANLRRIETRGAIETAHRALQNCGQVRAWSEAVRLMYLVGYVDARSSGFFETLRMMDEKRWSKAVTGKKLRNLAKREKEYHVR